MCVLHHTAGGLNSALATLWGSAEVSITFLISKAGDIFYGVRMGRRAWHCGRSRWRGIQDGSDSVNGLSIGIELENDGDGNDPYPQEQLDALDWLLVDFVKPAVGLIPNTRHRDISLEGKIDPSDNFPWHLYAGGIEQVEKRTLGKSMEVEMADIESVPLIKEVAEHPLGHEVYSLICDENMEDDWLVAGYPHYAPGAIGVDGKPQPESINVDICATDFDGKVIKNIAHTKLGAPHFYLAPKLPEIGGPFRLQVDYDKPGLGTPPYVRRIRVK
ncbi:MAG: N-acetylmuramoyl-L-alanine amidase [Thermoleophilia bacterium]